MTFLIDSIREKLGNGEEGDEGEKGFDDLNFKVGNTSGMDVGQIPSELAKRVGSTAKRGGGEMEIQITNPSTFHLDRDELFAVVDGLDIDFSIHSDPNVGYTSPYEMGEGGGFDGTHNYFTQYLESFASFKEEGERKYGFRIGRVNPHVSVSPLPQIEQERAQGVGLDPFGYNIGEFKREVFNEKSRKGKNMFENPEFLKNLYHVFVRDYLGEQEWQQFEQLFSNYSMKFDKKWRKAKNEVVNGEYKRRTGSGEDEDVKVMEKANMFKVAAQDQRAKNKWMDILKSGYSFEPVEVDSQTLETRYGKDKIENLDDLDQFVKKCIQRRTLSDIQPIPDFVYFMENKELGRMVSPILAGSEEDRLTRELEEIQEELWEKVKPVLAEAMDELWMSEPEEADGEEIQVRVSTIPVEYKIQVTSRELEIPQERIPKKAYDYGIRSSEIDLIDAAEELFSGEDLEYFKEKKDSEETDEEREERHRKFLERFAGQFEQIMWHQSNLFYRIIPAWLDVAHKNYDGYKDYEGHKGWAAPKFIWEHLVRRRWEEHKDLDKEVDLDLRNPRTENGESDDKLRYFDLLENNREFQMDVAAATASTYMWALFTQEKGRFDIEDRYVRQKFDLEGEENEKDLVEDIRKNGWTWIDWMNRFGIGMNMETMSGSHRQMFNLWRPKDVVTACRAINITARKRLEEGGKLGGLEKMHEDLYSCPVKFTIDMEHVSSFGVDPVDEMRILRDQEKYLLEQPITLDIDGEEHKIEVPGDPEKPLAKMVRMYHLTKPGHETSTSQTGHIHGPFRKGDEGLYRWLFRMVEWGFARTGEDGERASVMYEIGGDFAGTVYQAKLAMDMVKLGIDPDKDLDPARVDPEGDYDSTEEALIARFFNMDKSNFSSEWAKIEQNAFSPLERLINTKTFDKTYSSEGAIEVGELRPQEWPMEEYR